MYRAMQLFRSIPREAAVQKLPCPIARLKKERFCPLSTVAAVLHRVEQLQDVQQTLKIEPIAVVTFCSVDQANRELLPAIPGSISITTPTFNTSQTPPILAEMRDNLVSQILSVWHAEVYGTARAYENSERRSGHAHGTSYSTAQQSIAQSLSPRPSTAIASRPAQAPEHGTYAVEQSSQVGQDKTAHLTRDLKKVQPSAAFRDFATGDAKPTSVVRASAFAPGLVRIVTVPGTAAPASGSAAVNPANSNQLRARDRRP
jgi:hypothetical protein